jgi:hypothetical protein
VQQAIDGFLRANDRTVEPHARRTEEEG